ncbi:MAG: ABC transporter ATP-binding protein/permease [Candidatus Moeniiplasma glomeromycotorum]|nr:ABC transporter ATP-binding protein/permease [Candidatus Moeniiplasma glomeromycotorum]MCE8168142.1 ABC transporter ATP-binding protein/permease [Candidatus Moeniiplasma glomeromycotorum]MCE8169650.1 ABC transporter ATP-binding protein/permease [Candidatus Moeniiplasma glomeromycotorum]
MTVPPSLPKINFRSLYSKFKFKVVRHFLLTILRVILIQIIFGSIVELFQVKQMPNNFTAILVPKPLQKFLNPEKLSIPKSLFIVIGLGLVSFYAFIYYWDYLWEEELRVKGGHYTKNLLLDKFRRLPFETKQAKKDELVKLIESDSWEVGHYWEHLPNHIFHCFLEMVVVLFFYWGNFWEMTPQQLLFSLFFLLLLNLITYAFTRVILRNERNYKKKLDQEWAVINKERSQINLIESMGLNSQYQERQKKTTQVNENLVLNYSRTKSLSRVIPRELLMEVFPFLLLSLSQEWNGKILRAFWSIYGNFGSIFKCLWEYADYSSSLLRINNFLALPEKNDNLTGIKLNPQFSLQEVRFENISFRYTKSEKWVLRHYQRNFSVEKINHLQGANGIGKSTVLYLLLGQLTPQEGKITLTLTNGQTYDLQQINLDHWRKNYLVYYSHETLVEKGSTGQKQLANLQEVLKQRKSSQIFCFDEADNALDVKNQADFQEKLQELVKKGKLVIYIKH